MTQKKERDSIVVSGMTECTWHYNFQFKEFKFYCKACGKEESK